VALARKGWLDEAIVEFKKAIRLKRDYALAHTNLGIALNMLAWRLATCKDAKLRDPGRAVQLAKEATTLAPKAATYWTTLGVAHYRAGHWKVSIEALEKSRELKKDHSSGYFFLAMAHWQLGNKEETRKWFDKAVQWMEKNQPKNEELRRFRAEAAKLLG